LDWFKGGESRPLSNDPLPVLVKTTTAPICSNLAFWPRDVLTIVRADPCVAERLPDAVSLSRLALRQILMNASKRQA
jgi:hypothetical protein